MGTPFDDDDDLLLLLVAVEEDASQRRSMARKQRRRFTTFMTIADSSCWHSLFRFSEDEIDLCFPSSHAVMTHIYDRWHRLLRLDCYRLTEENCLQFASAIQRKGAPLNCCIGLFDGTRKHALKYQSVITPDSIVRHLHGPVPGTRHDAFLLATSTLSDEMRALPTSGSTRYIFYGDPAYSRNDCIISPFQGSTLNDDQLTFNKRMSKVRVSVEWVFGDVVQHFVTNSLAYHHHQ
ncbi:TPA: hypothetical protein N0F65_007515 [Lagenidium giganteum]|uniref:DDE Tnp4 domain-containing protein n=1 Tax=Lagenidium giganteum TaxID=4803 RepID=A0AAV2ZD09_9STRA|nr:TPA: hypothetical protein N0F65_007515 [Lagenidium giganteum]